jgi:hypothetical protein
VTIARRMIILSFCLGASTYFPTSATVAQTPPAAASPEPVQTWQPATSDQTGGNNEFVGDDSRHFTGPPMEPKPDPGIGYTIDPRQFKNTGPFRRVYSKKGFAFFKGKVFLPCSAGHFASNGTKDVEVGYVYVGGWGRGPQGAAVDAGFQKSSVQDGSVRDNYALIVKYERVPGMLALTTRYRCDQNLQFSFGPFKPLTLVLTAKGVAVDGVEREQTISVSTGIIDGWTSDGGGTSDGAIVKRMTTIAQPTGWSLDNLFNPSFNPQWNKSGTYFGHHSNDLTPLIRWTDCYIGKSSGKSTSVRWETWSKDTTEATQNFPADPTRVRYRLDDFANEVVAIDLHP